MRAALLALLLVGPAEAGETLQVVQKVKSGVVGLHLLVVLVRDQDLAGQGFAPEGWVQPSEDEYATLLDGRPSMLPYEHFMKAVEVGKVRPELGEQYTAWVAAKKAADLQEDAD